MMKNIVKLVRIGLYIMVFVLVVYRPPAVVLAWQEVKTDLPEHVKAHVAVHDSKPIKGVDLSHFNGKVDVQQLAQSHIKFVYLKATQGIGYVDPTFIKHATALQQTQLLRGAYHFFEPEEDAIQQAEHFIITVQTHQLTLPPVLDIEITQHQNPDVIRAGVQKWLDKVEQSLGCKPVIYTYGDFWADNLGEQFADYAFWLADYAKKPTVPQSAKHWKIWQYSDKGRVKGIESHVDLDVLITEELNCHV